MKKLKNNRQKGITLIALVVTITVLIILATVSINTVLGDNGIIKRAQKARDSYSNSQKSEDEQMAVLANEMAEYDEGESSGGGIDTPTKPVEGITATEVAYKISRELNIDMPITEAIYSVLYQGANPNEAVLELMTRSKKHEMEEVVNNGLFR